MKLGNSMSNKSQFDDQRRSPRRTASMGASISHPRHTEDICCIVRNISPDGALLESPLARDLLVSFWLRLEGDTTPRFCIVAWRSGRQVGVEFSQQIIERGIGHQIATVCGIEANPS
jgi:hypothetical protein